MRIKVKKVQKKNKNMTLLNDILTGDPNDENLDLPPLS